MKQISLDQEYESTAFSNNKEIESKEVQLSYVMNQLISNIKFTLHIKQSSRSWGETTGAGIMMEDNILLDGARNPSINDKYSNNYVVSCPRGRQILKLVHRLNVDMAVCMLFHFSSCHCEKQQS